MDLVKSWAVAVVVVLVGSVISAVAFINYGSLAQIGTLTGRTLVFYLPSLVVTLLAALAAALVHPRPQREQATRHALAAVAVPAVSIVVGLIGGVVQGSPVETYVATVITGVIGAVAGWKLADLVRRPNRRLQPNEYPY